MLSELKNNPKVVGAKQVRRSLKEGGALRVFIAGDADPQLTDPIRAMCRERGRAGGGDPLHAGAGTGLRHRRVRRRGGTGEINLVLAEYPAG